MNYYKNRACLAIMLLLSGFMAAQTNNLTGGTTNTTTTDLVKEMQGKEDNGTGVLAVGGIEQSGFASLTNQTGAFVKLLIRGGLNDKHWRAWGDVRLLGQPTASTGGVIAAFQDPTGQIKTDSLQTVGQAVDFMAGIDYRLTPSAPFSLHLIGGVGATTPLSSQSIASKFTVPAKGTQQCNLILSQFTPQNGYPAGVIVPNTANTTDCLANGINVLAFNPAERTSFLRKYLFGVRLINRYWYKDASGATQSQHGIVDFTLGQDEAVTGGKLHGWVVRLDATYPMAINGMNYLYLFGTASIRATYNHPLQTVILNADTSNATPSSPNVALLPLLQPNKDYYRIGVGLDIKKLFTKLFTPQQKTAGANNPAPNATNNPTN